MTDIFASYFSPSFYSTPIPKNIYLVGIGTRVGTVKTLVSVLLTKSATQYKTSKEGASNVSTCSIMKKHRCNTAANHSQTTPDQSKQYDSQMRF